MPIMFKQPLVLSGALWIGMAIVGAGGSTQPVGQQPVKSPATADDTVTIVGCLVQGDPSLNVSQRPADTGTPGSGDYFVRTPVIQAPVGATVTVGSSAATPGKTTLYRVLGLDRDELQSHLGHRVEVQGHLKSDDTSLGVTTKTTVDAGGRPTTQVEKRMDLAGAIHATAIKMVSASCQ